MRRTLLFGTLFCVLTLSKSQTDRSQGLNPCTAKETCHECIQTSACSWCGQPDFGDKPRCFQPSMTSFIGSCEEAYVFSPGNRLDNLENQELTKSFTFFSGHIFLNFKLFLMFLFLSRRLWCEYERKRKRERQCKRER